MTTYLSRDAILQAEDIATEDVAVPEWGGTVRVKAMTGAQRDRLEKSATDGKGRINKDGFFARIVAWCVVDERGDRIFSEADIVELGEKAAGALIRVATAAQRLSAIKAEDVEALTGN